MFNYISLANAHGSGNATNRQDACSVFKGDNMNRRLFILIILSVIGWMVAYSSSVYADSFISGKIVSETGNQAIANIFVDASNQCGGTWYGSGKSDAEGNYLIKIPAGTYYLSTSSSGTYLDEWWNSGDGTVQCGEAVSVTVAEGQTVSGINFTLKGKGGICGQITANNGQALAGVKLNAADQCDGSLYGSGTSDSEGNYLIEGLPEGSYYVSTYSVSYPAEWWNAGEGTPDCENAVQISVVTGQNTCNIDFKLGAGQISGKVTTGSGQAVANIKIEATDSPCGGNLHGDGLTDTSGNYVIPALPAGTYYVHAYSESKAYNDKWWNNVTDCNESVQISVTEGQTVSGIDFSLNKSAEISGTVLDERDNLPIPNIKVSISDLCGETVFGESITDDAGKYAVVGLLPGSYYVFAYDENKKYQNEWQDTGSGTVNCSNAAQITVTSGQIVSADFKLKLNTPGKISGTVTDSKGQPVGNISVGVWGLCNEAWYNGSTSGADGKYTVSDIPEGSDYYIFAFDSSGTYVSEWWNNGDGTSDCSKASWVSVIAGQTVSGTDFRLDQGGTISGKITAGSGLPLENIQIDVWDSCDGTLYAGTGKSDIGGNYSIQRISSGSYYLFVSDGTHHYSDIWWDSGKGTGDCSKAVSVTVTSGQITAVNISLDEPGSISGKITSSDRQPIPNVCVDVWDLCGENWYGKVKSDAQGAYSIRLGPGTYYLVSDASCEGQQNYYTDEWRNSSGGTRECSQASPVTVTTGHETSGIDFQLESGGAISGKVTAVSDGQSIKDVCVVVTDNLCEKPMGGDQTDDQGIYFISGVPPGSYYVFTVASCETKQNYADEWWDNREGTPVCNKAEPVTVTAGQTASGINFSLFEAGVTVDESGGVSVSEKGTTDSYTVRLNAPPSEDVVITMSYNKQQIQLSSDSLRFTADNWDQAQRITVSAVDDTLGEGTHLSDIAHTGAGGGYDDIQVPDVTVSIADDAVRLTFVANGGVTTPRGSVIVDTDAMPYPISVSPSLGYRFLNWTSMPSGIIENTNTASAKVNTTADATITAHFDFDWSAKISISPKKIYVTDTTKTFDIDVVVENVMDLGAYQFSLDYDSALADIANESNAVSGPFLGKTGRTVEHFVNLDTPENPLAVAVSSGKAAGPSGAGVLEKIRFTVEKPPESDSVLRLKGVELTNASGPPFSVLPVDETTGEAVIARAYTVKIAAGTGGTITPSGEVIVGHGESRTFTIAPADGCYVTADVAIDGVSKGPITSYTFTDVNKNHTLTANFTLKSHVITAGTDTGGGTISPSGNTTVNCGSDQTFMIKPDSCYRIADVLTDGVSVLNAVEMNGDEARYTLRHITGNHTIKAVFAVKTYTVTAGAKGTCSITPSGTITAECGTDKTFAVAFDPLSVKKEVVADGNSVGSPAEYVFRNISENHTIYASTETIHLIQVIVSGQGTVSPAGDASGNIAVVYGEDQTFTVFPQACSKISDVKADGRSVLKDVKFEGDTGSYTFSNVTANHTLEVSFTAASLHIEAFTDSDIGGKISPVGKVAVNCGAEQSFTITPDDCYVIKDVLADGKSVMSDILFDGDAGTYTFSDVREKHALKAVFALRTFTLDIITEGDGSGTFTVEYLGADGSSAKTLSGVMPPITLSCGSRMKITANPECSDFVGWLEDGNISGTEDMTWEDIRSDKTVAAAFDLIRRGDINKDGNVDLKDVILALQISAGAVTTPSVTRSDDSEAEITVCADINGDKKVGLGEAVYDLNLIAEML